MNTGKASIELVNGKSGQVYTDGLVSTSQGRIATIQFYNPLTGELTSDRYKINYNEVVSFTWGS